MKTTPALSRIEPRSWLFLIGILFISLLAINHQSLWIDEANTALKSEQASWAGWWHEMIKVRGSDMQMPFYMVWMWVCGRIFGSSEIALRAVNLFWLVPGMFMLWRSLARRPGLQVCVFLAVIFSPFVWYYLDEARPYAMQIGASLCVLAGIIHWSENEIVPGFRETLWVSGFALGLVALCGASMLGVIWAGTAVLALVFLLPIERLLRLGRSYFTEWLNTVLLLAALGVYYIWTLKSGARASDVGTTGWKNAAFVAYELLGFSGLGPGRLDIRNTGIHVFMPYLPVLASFAVLNLLVVFFAVRGFLERNSQKTVLILTIIVALPVLFLLAAGVALYFRVLGRHFAPLLAVVVLILGTGLTSLWQRGPFGKLMVTGYLLFCLSSCFFLRFEPRHFRDDYRGAAALANQELVRGGRVWWDADVNGAKYYDLPLTTNSAATDAAMVVNSPSPDLLTTAPEPEVVCCSRPDIYDSKGVLAKFLAEDGYQRSAALPAFVIWTKPPKR